MLSQLMIAIALWCAPIESDKYDYTAVNACRQELIKCVNKTLEEKGNIWDSEKCFVPLKESTYHNRRHYSHRGK